MWELWWFPRGGWYTGVVNITGMHFEKSSYRSKHRSLFGFITYMELYLPQHVKLRLHTHTGKTKARLHYVTVLLWEDIYVICQASDKTHNICTHYSISHTQMITAVCTFLVLTQIQQPRNVQADANFQFFSHTSEMLVECTGIYLNG